MSVSAGTEEIDFKSANGYATLFVAVLALAFGIAIFARLVALDALWGIASCIAFAFIAKGLYVLQPNQAALMMLAQGALSGPEDPPEALAECRAYLGVGAVDGAAALGGAVAGAGAGAAAGAGNGSFSFFSRPSVTSKSVVTWPRSNNSLMASDISRMPRSMRSRDSRLRSSLMPRIETCSKV